MADKKVTKIEEAKPLSKSEVSAAKEGIQKITASVDTVIQGKHDIVELVIMAAIAGGHVLLEDLPGTGKTTLVKALAKSTDMTFSRIQFTPDLMPSDVTGFTFYDQQKKEFRFMPGGVFGNLILADEINRASAKTQSALLEAMSEGQVTVDGITHVLEQPFTVIATQNPIEQFGTYPLPEAQLDRFMVKLSIGYPEFEQSVQVLKLGEKAKKAITSVATAKEFLSIRDAAERVHASDMMLRYIMQIITATRDNADIQIGSSIRGAESLLALTRVRALADGRSYIIPDDVKPLAVHVLRHRITLSHTAKTAGKKPDDVIAAILGSIHVPHIEEDELKGKKQ
jgi:MoxR-like ATPase